jgi:beta-xylosidase
MRVAVLVAWFCALCTLAGEASKGPTGSQTQQPPAVPPHPPASVEIGPPSTDANTAPLAPCLDFPMRDVCVCKGHDDWFYLTGTTGYPDWDTRNDGIWVWRSPDLKKWERIGKVWDLSKDGTWQKMEMVPKTKDATNTKETTENTQHNIAIWGPEICYHRKTYWISYGLSRGGTGLLKSTTGMIAGPYEDMGQITQDGFDASLFVDKEVAYWIYQDGRIARMKKDMKGLAEEPNAVLPQMIDEDGRQDVNALRKQRRIGTRGAFLTRINGRYMMFCTEPFNRFGAKTDDVFVASADNIKGPYSARTLVLPHGGQSMLFTDREGRPWMTFSGDKSGFAVFHERPGLVPMEYDQADGRLRPARSVILEQGTVARTKSLITTPLKDSAIHTDHSGSYYLLGLPQQAPVTQDIHLWQSKDLQQWEPLGRIWRFPLDVNDSAKQTMASDPNRDPSHPVRVTILHYLKKTYWIPYAITGVGTGLLKSTSGLVQGPYVEVAAFTSTNLRQSTHLFADTDGTVYLCQGNTITPLNDDFSAQAASPISLVDTRSNAIGDRADFIAKVNTLYILGESQWHGDVGVDGTYDLMYRVSKSVFGPYGPPRLAVPHGGGGTLFKGHDDIWYTSLVGHDRSAPFQSRLGVVPVDVNALGDDVIIKPSL